MGAIWAESLGLSFEQALDQLAGAVRECPAELWERPMWRVPDPGADREIIGPGDVVALGAERDGLVQRWSTPWAVAWHALEVLDYDLNGEFGPWSPPPPFAGHPHWRDVTRLAAGWRRDEMAGYVEHCRMQVRGVLAEMTEELAARPLPAPHRYQGQPHARIITGLLVHTTEHAAQIRQFISSAD